MPPSSEYREPLVRPIRWYQAPNQTIIHIPSVHRVLRTQCSLTGGVTASLPYAHSSLSLSASIQNADPSGRSLAAFAGSIPAEDMHVCLLFALCIVKWKSDLSSRGFQPCVVRLCVTSTPQPGDVGPSRAVRPQKKSYNSYKFPISKCGFDIDSHCIWMNGAQEH